MRVSFVTEERPQSAPSWQRSGHKAPLSPPSRGPAPPTSPPAGSPGEPPSAPHAGTSISQCRVSCTVRLPSKGLSNIYDPSNIIRRCAFQFCGSIHALSGVASAESTSRLRMYTLIRAMPRARTDKYARHVAHVDANNALNKAYISYACMQLTAQNKPRTHLVACIRPESGVLVCAGPTVTWALSSLSMSVILDCMNSSRRPLWDSCTKIFSSQRLSPRAHHQTST